MLKKLFFSYKKQMKKTISEAKPIFEDDDINFYKWQAGALIEIYYLIKDDFNVWLNRFEYVAEIVKVPKCKMSQFFYNLVDERIHSVVKIYHTDIDFDIFSYEEIIFRYLYYLNPYQIDPHRPRFHSRKQYTEEPIEKYGERLEKIYWCLNAYKSDDELRSQFIHGLLDDNLRMKLSKIPQLSFKTALIKALELSKCDIIEYYVNQAHLRMNTYNFKDGGFFYTWLDKFEYVACAIGVEPDKMLKFFNRMIDANVQAAVMDKYRNINFFNISYEQLKDIYLHFFLPSTNVEVYKIRFLMCIQYEHEPFMEYINRLIKLHIKCYRRFTSLPGKELHTQFINGIHNKYLKNILIKTPNLSMDKTIQMAVNFEKKQKVRMVKAKALKQNIMPIFT